MKLENEKRVELLAWAKQGIHECFKTTRGANMFGSKAEVKAVDNMTLEIRTYDGISSVPTYWEIKLLRKI